jgi:hypothetical protein
MSKHNLHGIPQPATAVGSMSLFRALLLTAIALPPMIMAGAADVLAQSPLPRAAPSQPAPARALPQRAVPQKAAPQKAAPQKVAPQRGIVRHEPIIFFIARGRPDACGPGCDTWIGAEGTFDPDAVRRITEFLAVSGRQSLPIFFHSPGGELQPSLAIGHLLREKRMTAGIGQTLPDGCREGSKADAACRNAMRSGRIMPARLQVSSGVCASGCAYALIGASTRLIGQGARFGVHANRVIARPDHADDIRRAGPGARHSAESQSYDLLRHYVTVAGVDPELIDLAVRTPHNRVHWLSRDELERFGLVPDDFFETRWFRHAKPDGSTFIIKSLTQVMPTQEHRTTNIAINCVPNTRATVMLRRELGAAENTPQPVVRLSSGEAFVLVFSHGNRSTGATEVRVQPVAADALARVAASDGIVFREEGAREFRLSTKGLSEALGASPMRCGGRA